MKKDDIALMRKCAKIGDSIFTKVCNQLQKHAFETEIQLADFIKKEIHKAGGIESFPVIVTSGPRAGNDIHPIPTGSKLKGFVIIDFGLKMDGYCSDMTRTVYVGKPTKTVIDLYTTLLNAQNEAALYFRAGIPVSVPDAYVRGVLSQHTYKGKTLGEYFIHTLGHGISKKVHEKPSIYLKSKEVFKAGKMVTNEPGIYIPNTLGIRIEDMYVITNAKVEHVTKSKKELLIFPY